MEAIHDYLRRIAEDLRNGTVPLAQFVINKVGCGGDASRAPFRVLMPWPCGCAMGVARAVDPACSH